MLGSAAGSGSVGGSVGGSGGGSWGGSWGFMGPAMAALSLYSLLRKRPGQPIAMKSGGDAPYQPNFQFQQSPMDFLGQYGSQIGNLMGGMNSTNMARQGGVNLSGGLQQIGQNQYDNIGRLLQMLMGG